MNGAVAVVVSLNVPPLLEARVVDWLLGRESVAGFTSFAAHGHGAHGPLSIAEQVSGHQRRVEIRIEMAREQLDAFLADLEASFRGADLYYVALPAIVSGHLSAG